MGVCRRWWGVASVLAGLAVGAAGLEAHVARPAGDRGMTAGTARVTYTFERPGLAVPKFRFAVGEDGTGVYKGEQVTSGRGDGQVEEVSADVTLGAATTAKIFKAARAEKFFHVACASKAKNIADTGAKTLSYDGPEGKGTCAYNYSENKDVVMLTDLFLAISTTLEEGRKLEFKRRYDHLGLDAELDLLTQANDTGRAVELSTIAPVLRQLSGDTEMMERVRLRAAKLLDRAASGR